MIYLYYIYILHDKHLFPLPKVPTVTSPPPDLHKVPHRATVWEPPQRRRGDVGH